MKELVIKFAQDSENAELNFDLAYAYHERGQTASAMSYYLRAAERGSDLLAYESLIRAHYCTQKQRERDFTAKGFLKQAQLVCPRRPEAYYLLAKYHVSKNEHSEAYVQLKLAKEFCSFNEAPLKTKVGYKNKIQFEKELIHAAWEWDKNSESRSILKELLSSYEFSVADEEDKKDVHDIIDQIGIYSRDEAYCQYTKHLHSRLCYPFNGSSDIERNFSQVYQDLFVLYMNKGKRDGTYLEVGCGPAFQGSNTALLEEFGWKGISIDKDPQYAMEHNKFRSNTTIFDDALTIDYSSLLKKHFPDKKEIDYLQLDLEPARNTFECLLSIPFDEYKFGVVTYEHDYYIDPTKSYRKKSRRYLEMMGYKLVVADVSPDGFGSFEDWWVHPDMVSESQISMFQYLEGGVCNINKHMFEIS